MNLTSACPSNDRLVEMASGNISAVQAEELEQHLVNCASCCAVVAAAMESDPVTQLAFEAGWPPVPTDEETERLSRRIAAAVETRLDQPLDTVASFQGPHAAQLGLSWLEPADSPNEMGRLGSFIVVRLLGRGGMGAVFEAEDTRLRRRVALKVMLPGASADRSMKERFLREARSAAAVHHRHVVTIFEVGESGSVPFLAMELLGGESLQDRLRRDGRLTPLHAMEIAAQVAEGLSAAHQKGVLHRDIKPGNIWLESLDLADPDPPITVKLLDFGLAKAMGTEDGLTQAGVVMGTLNYLSPEQARGAKVDERSDLFSLGCMLYQMLSGEFPFEGSDPLSQLNALATSEPLAIKHRTPEIPDSLASLIHRLLARNLDDRPATAKEVATELRRIREELVEGKTTQTPAIPTVLTLGDQGSGTRHRIKMFAAGFAPILILLGIIVITIRHRDGTKTEIEIDVSSDAAVAESKSTLPGISLNTDLVAASISAGPLQPTSSLSHLDPSTIPESERFDWQPKELVAVIGEHRLRHWGRVGQIRFHPSGRFFITVPYAGPAGLWMTSTLEQREAAFVDNIAQSFSCEGFEFSQDGKWLSSANRVYAVDVTNADEPEIRLAQTLPTDENRFGSSDVAIHGNRWLIMASDAPGNLMLWDIAVDPRRYIKSIQFDAVDPLTGICWSTDGRQLAASNWDGAVRVWDVDWTNADNPEFTLRDQQVPGSVATLSPQGSVMATGGDGHEKITFWDVSREPFRQLHQIPGGRQFALSPDGKCLAVAPGGSGIQLYAEENTQWVSKQLLTGAMPAVLSLAWSPDQKTLVAGDQFGGVHVWDLSVDPPKSRMPNLPASNVQSLTFAPNGKSMLVVGSDHQATHWNLDGTAPSRVNWNTFCDSGHLPSFSPDSKLARVHDHVWNLGTEPPVDISDAVNVLTRFVPEGNGLLSLDTGTLFKRSWQPTKRGRFITGGEHAVWKSASSIITNDAIETLQFEAQRFATRHDDQTVCVWSLANTEKPLYELKHNLKFGNSSRPLTLSSDGTILLVFSQQESVVWDLEETPPRLYPLQLDAHTANAFFSKDNKLLFAADGHGVGVYDWVNNREVRRLKFPGAVRQIVLHPDGKHIATANSNGTVYFLRTPEMSDD